MAKQLARNASLRGRGGLVEAQRDGGLLETPADLMRDRLESDRALPGAVQRAARREPSPGRQIERGGIETVDRGPAIGAVADVGRDAVAARSRDQHRDKAAITGPVDGGRQPNHTRAHACSAKARQACSPGTRSQ